MNKYLEKIAEFNDVPTGEYVAGGIIGGSLGAIGGLVSAERKNKPVNAALQELSDKREDRRDLLDWVENRGLSKHPKIDAIVDKAVSENRRKNDYLNEAGRFRSYEGRMAGEITPRFNDFPLTSNKFEKYMELPRNHRLSAKDVEHFFGDTIKYHEERGAGAINPADFREAIEKRVAPLKERKSALRKSILDKQITKLEATKVGSGKRALIGAGIGALGGMGAAWMAHQGE